MVVEIRDWCQNVGEYNTYNFCIWHFGLCVIVSKIERCRSSDPPYEIAINPWWRGGRGLPSLIALLNGRWFLQIPVVDRDSWNLFPLYPLFPCSDFVSQMLGWFGGGGGVMFFSHFMLFPTFLENKSGNTKQLFLI